MKKYILLLVLIFSCQNHILYKDFKFVSKYSNEDFSFITGVKDNKLYILNLDSKIDCFLEIPTIRLINKQNKSQFYGSSCKLFYCCNMQTSLDSTMERNGVMYYYISQILIRNEEPYNIDLQNNHLRSFKYSKENGVEDFIEVNKVNELIWPY